MNNDTFMLRLGNLSQALFPADYWDSWAHLFNFIKTDLRINGMENGVCEMAWATRNVYGQLVVTARYVIVQQYDGTLTIRPHRFFDDVAMRLADPATVLGFY